MTVKVTFQSALLIVGLSSAPFGMAHAQSADVAQSRQTRTEGRSTAQAGAVDSLNTALQRAFVFNPDIRAQRSALRAAVEQIPQARSAQLPQVSATTYAGVNATTSLFRGNPNFGSGGTIGQRGVGLAATQNLYDGGKTPNAVWQASSQVTAAREQLRAIEQGILLEVVTTYLATFTGQALVEVQKRNVAFLQETLNTTRTRLGAGVATPTDVSQAEARLSRGRADLNAVETDLSVARDRFTRLVGAMPGNLRPVSAIDRLLPRNADSARSAASGQNPAVLAAVANVRAAEAAVRISQAQMLPQVNLQAQVSRDYDTEIGTRRIDSAQVVGRVTVPLYQGGGPEAQTRQSRELLGQTQSQLDSARLQARSSAFAGYRAFENATFAVRAATDEVRAASETVEGVRRQQEAGLRTIQELLNAQQDFVSARSRLVLAQSDRLIASYTVLAATGRLEFEVVGIARPRVPDVAAQTDFGVRTDAWRDLRAPVGPSPAPSSP
ncbi:MAG: TolC family outer membrane protein [Alphaproteobacteria bacterium]